MIDQDVLTSAVAPSASEQLSPLGVLRRYARAGPQTKPVERCQLCSTRLPAEHQHLIDRRTRRLVCCCDACGVLFASGQSAAYRRVPRSVQSLPDFRLSDAQWDGLQIPINLAFFYRSEAKPGEGGDKMIAVYPSPAGLIESLLELDSWQSIADDNPSLGDLQPEVEALLVNRLWGEHFYYLVPIDECYRLSGLIRLRWRGLSGGSEVWEEVERYFDRLKEKSWST